MKEFFIVAGAHLIAVISPGPDFAVILKQAISAGRRPAVISALGVASGIAVHVTYCIIGIAVIVSKSIFVFNIIKYLGALYLIWLGILAIRSSAETVLQVEQQTKNDSNHFKIGFLTSALNPKSTLFFLSLFTQVINSETSSIVKIVYGFEMVIVTFIWFALVSVFITQEPVVNMYERVKDKINKIFGVVLIGLGLKVGLGS